MTRRSRKITIDLETDGGPTLRVPLDETATHIIFFDPAAVEKGLPLDVCERSQSFTNMRSAFAAAKRLIRSGAVWMGIVEVNVEHSFHYETGEVLKSGKIYDVTLSSTYSWANHSTTTGRSGVESHKYFQKLCTDSLA